MWQNSVVVCLVIAAGIYLFRRYLRRGRACSCGCAGCARQDECIAENTMPLRQLKLGEKALVARILAEGELGRRIRDMGLVPGAELTVIGRAPLKDPVALRLKGFTLSLRNNEADFILVSRARP